MYTLDHKHRNRNTAPNTTYTFRFSTNANINMNSTALERNPYSFRFSSDVISNMIAAGQQQVNPYNVLYRKFASCDLHDKETYVPFDTSAPMREDIISLGSSTSRIYDDVMSIDTFPCVPIGVVTCHETLHWVDVPLVITCVHTCDIIDDEEISMADFNVIDMTSDDDSVNVISSPIFSPIENRSTNGRQWHFDIDIVESDALSVNTVETWSMSEDFS